MFFSFQLGWILLVCLAVHFLGVFFHDRKLQKSKNSYWKILVSMDDSSQSFVVLFLVFCCCMFFICAGVQTLFFGVNPIVG